MGLSYNGPVPLVKTFWLSMHVPYACRHSGACCSSGWAVPVEHVRVAGIQGLTSDSNWLLPVCGAPADVAGVLATHVGGRCVFYRRPTRQERVGRVEGAERSEGGDGCEIHYVLGHSSLPAACQHFPRECLIDPRGVFVTLSQYCPTAADLLFDHAGRVEIVEGPPAVPGGHAEGLDARDVMPPLLTPGVLMDHGGYSAWEAHMIHTLAGSAGAPQPEDALNLLVQHAKALTRWRPGTATLAHAIGELDSVSARPQTADVDWRETRCLFEVARGALADSHTWLEIPPHAVDIWRAHVANAWRDYSHVLNRFLAAHAFAAWMAYQGNGLLAMMQHLCTALAVLRIEAIRVCSADGEPLTRARLKHAIRQTDLLLMHLADRERLAAQLSVHSSAPLNPSTPSAGYTSKSATTGP